MDGPALAIRAGKHDRTPVFVDLNRLLAAKPNDRAKFLKDEADRGKVTDKVGKALLSKNSFWAGSFSSYASYGVHPPAGEANSTAIPALSRTSKGCATSAKKKPVLRLCGPITAALVTMKRTCFVMVFSRSEPATWGD
jgi:hypothetical protein